MILDPRAQDYEIAAHARNGVSGVRTVLSGIGRAIHEAETSAGLRLKLSALADSMGAKGVQDDVPLSGVIGRMLEPQWWRRGLRTQLLRTNEAIEHGAGHVRRSRQCYVSDHAVKVKRLRAKAGREVLEGLEVCNELGQAFNLAEVSDASVSNPKLRRSELMTRCRGFEEIAQYMGHEAVFLTITAPSRFHRFDAAGRDNPKYSGATPRDAQKYLCKVWKNLTQAWKRHGFYPYGFRVAEPHHDGCPHWHVLLFAPKEHMGWFVPRRFVADRADYGAGLLGIAGAYALQDSAGEAGAVKHRFKVERIDGSKGSATGYIAKYICKNIDGIKEGGEGMGLDFASGTPADRAAERVRVWASTWGIRQFQQVGGPSVTVWRELRRLGQDREQPLQLDLFELPRSAADRGMWALFWLLQGGPDVRRKNLTLKPLYREQQDRYGGDAKRIFGVEGNDGEAEHGLRTRLHDWVIQRAGKAETERAYAERLDDMRTERNLTAYVKAAGFRDLEDFQRSGEAASTWTGVNNCTDEWETDDAAALAMDLSRGGAGQLTRNHHESIDSGPPGHGSSPH